MFRVLAFVALTFALAATGAAADPAGEQLFRDGRELLKQGKVDEACEKFQKSREVEAKVGTLLNLADCRERQGKLATAWEVFLEAKALAAQQKDPRAVEAGQRAGAIAGKRAFLTVAVAADRRVPGLVVTRNGAEVPSATWDTELPIDPGSYVIEAKAGGYQSALVRVDVAPSAHANASVPVLTKVASGVPVDPGRVEPVGPVGPQPPIDRPTPPPSAIDPPLRNGALGLAVGATTDGDVTPGVRAIAQIEAGPGAVRGVFNIQYARLTNNPTDNSDNSNLVAFGLGLDYLFAWKPGIASAGGLGFGLDLYQGGYNETSTHQWLAVRASPVIVRLRKAHLELGLHAVVIVQSSPVAIVTAAVDWFFR